MSDSLADTVDHYICQVKAYEWIDGHEDVKRTVYAYMDLRRAFARAHPRRAFCDVLSGERFEWPEGVSGVAYGPQDALPPEYWH